MATAVPDAIGNYKILEKIGHGGMGTLYRARDPRIGRDVAIKLLREGVDSAEMQERLLREARSAGVLKHGNIVTIFELGEHLGQPFIAMEYVQGETLAKFLKRRAPVPLERKLQLMDQLCAGLYYAHRMNVVHRDIKPANIMIDDEGAVKILDFGIARMGASTMTMTGMLMGTLNYMSPEQMEGKPIDGRADIFSVGAVLYELLSYRPAFPGDTQSAIMYSILRGRPEPLEQVCPGLDSDLIAIVDRCLEKQPEDRFPDLAVLRQGLAAVRQRVERSAQDPTVVGLPSIGAGTPSQAPASSSPRRDSSAVDRLSVRAEQIRAEQIQGHLERATRALNSGDHDAAFAACEQALVLDPKNEDALDLEERTRTSMERLWLSEAQSELVRGALTSAWLLAERVLSINAASVGAEAVRRAVQEARARLAEAQERALAFDRLFAQAQRDLAAGSLESASTSVDQALAIDATRADAKALKEAILSARSARRRAEEDARARATADKARRLFDGGDHAAAFATLEEFAPAHAAVTQVLLALRQEVLEINRTRAEAERLKAEAERQAERRRLEAERDRLEAERLRVEGERRRKEDAERRRKEKEDEERRAAEALARARRESEQCLAAAVSAFEAKHWNEAMSQVQAALRVDPTNDRGLALKKKIEAVLARQQIEAAWSSAVTVASTSPPVAEPAGAKTASPAPSAAPPITAPLPPPARVPPPIARVPDVAPQPMPTSVATRSSGGTPWLLISGAAVVAILAVVIIGIQFMRSDRTPPPAPVAQSGEDATHQHLALGKAALDRGDFDEAIREADAALALDAASPDATVLKTKALDLKASAPAVAGNKLPPARPAVPSDPPPTTKPAVKDTSNKATLPDGGRDGGKDAGKETGKDQKKEVDSQTPRARELSDQYARAKAAFDGGSLASAVGLLEALQREDPSYRDVSVLIARAREGMADAAKKALDAGTRLESTGELAAALKEYQRMPQLDPSTASSAERMIERLRTRMKAEAAVALANAKQFEALDRIDSAITWYERAYRTLPDDDPGRSSVKERLDALRARK